MGGISQPASLDKLTLSTTALKYHPDRNPGRELEFNSKFQAIQSANEVLTDTAQRAKYDADRIRSGLFYSYASPTRPNMPPRSPATNFPPPPRPPPTAAKTNYAPPSGTNRYTQYTNADAARSRPNTEAEDAQTKANAFKAWEQMRHGQGPPPSRKVPPRPTRTAFDSRPTSNGVPEEPLPRRTAPGWEEYQETQPVPRMARANTTRVPKNPQYTPTSAGGDVPPTQNKSAYTHVRPDRTYRANPQYVPPPPPPQRKADPLRAFRSHLEGEDVLNNSDRISTPYATMGGEKTYFSSDSLGRNTNSQERSKSAEWRENERCATDKPQSRAASATSDRQHRSASPKMRTSTKQMPASSSSSSSSSSDESVLPQRSSGTRHARARNPTSAPQKPILKPSVKISDADDTGGVQPGHAGLRNGWTDAPRKPQATEPFGSDQPEGFLQHRMKRESMRNDPDRQASMAEEGQNGQTKPKQPLHRPRSWNEQYGTPKKATEAKLDSRPVTGDPKQQGPMYEPPGYSPSPSTPSSHKWAEQWPFMSPRKPRTSSERPPYWAVPSSLPPSGLPPSKQGAPEASEWLKNSSFLSQGIASDPFVSDADFIPGNSFTFPMDDVKKPFAGAPPLRSRSSESINTNFSPPQWNGAFTSGNDYFIVAQEPKGSRASSTGTRPVPPPPPPRQEHVPSTSAPPTGADFAKKAGTTSTSAAAPASPLNPLSTSKEDWAQHFKPPTWEYPPPASASPVKGASRKRAKTPRNYSKVPSKRPQATSVSEAVDEHVEDPGAASAESLSSRTSDNDSAMDIDPILTPPSGQSNGEHRSSLQTDQTVTGQGRRSGRPGRPGPPVPPRPGDQSNNEPQELNLGELKNVAPFAPDTQGLKDLKDLKSSLPFESRPSGKAISNPPPKPLELPNPPKAPQVPTTLTQTSWERYLAQMRSYMFEWNTYNAMMLAHFTERQSNVGTLNGDWMSAVGDKGYNQYLQGIEEDFRVRQHWDVSWERHQECIKGLGTVRQRMLGARNGS